MTTLSHAEIRARLSEPDRWQYDYDMARFGKAFVSVDGGKVVALPALAVSMPGNNTMTLWDHNKGE